MEEKQDGIALASKRFCRASLFSQTTAPIANALTEYPMGKKLR